MFIPDVVSEEVEALTDAARSLLGAHVGPDTLRRVADGEPYSPELWKQMARMGLHGIGIPEDLGGSGGRAAEVYATFRETGRVLLASPFLASVGLAARAVLHAGDSEARRTFLPALAAGELVATLAIAETSGSWDPADVNATAAADGTLHGTKDLVLDALSAQTVLVVARGGHGVGLYAVEAGAPGLQILPLTTLDLTRPMAKIRLDGAKGTLLSGPDDATDAIRAGIDAAALLLTAEQVGGAEQVMASALAYAKTREQFGQTIGSFQAIKHKLADMAFDLERMKSAGWHAARASELTGDEGVVALDLAQSFCSEAYVSLTAENIQVHGGIGYTWEHPAHLYFRRAKASQVLLGGPAGRRRSLLQRLENRSVEVPA